MKFDRHKLNSASTAGFSRLGCRFRWVLATFMAISLVDLGNPCNAQAPATADATSSAPPPVTASTMPSQSPVNETRTDANAHALALRTMEQLAMGDAFDAKLRQRIWAGGRVVVGVGHYEQSGGGTGRYSLELTIHDGDTRQTIKQISDGKLSWHRSHIGEAIVVRRVDLGRIDEYEREFFAASPANDSKTLVPPTRFASHLSHPSFKRMPTRLLVGGLVELLDQINSDYNLRLTKGIVDRQPVWILRGQLSEAARTRIRLASPGRDEWAPLCPVEVRVAIAATPDPTGFGAGLPIRVEFWTEPQAAMPLSPTAPSDPAAEIDSDETEPGTEATAADDRASGNSAPAGRLISLLEIYSMRKIEPSPEERFRFINDDRVVSFANETSRYLDRVARP
jgi:hypothetical protein